MKKSKQDFRKRVCIFNGVRERRPGGCCRWHGRQQPHCRGLGRKRPHWGSVQYNYGCQRRQRNKQHTRNNCMSRHYRTESPKPLNGAFFCVKKSTQDFRKRVCTFNASRPCVGLELKHIMELAETTTKQTKHIFVIEGCTRKKRTRREIER